MVLFYLHTILHTVYRQNLSHFQSGDISFFVLPTVDVQRALNSMKAQKKWNNDLGGAAFSYSGLN